MAKNDKCKDRLVNMGSKLNDTTTQPPLQEHKEGRVEPVSNEAEKLPDVKFTVHIPGELMDQIRTIGFKEKKKLKAIFKEALEAYVSQKS